MSDRLRLPAATYRLQLNKGFRFRDSMALVPYLHRLGISDVYASPVFQARRGSLHGYDVTDPTRLNSELGAEKDFDTLVAELRRWGMGMLLDIVPNHMAVSDENRWWADVRKRGLKSPFAAFFDTDWLNFRDVRGGVEGYRRFFDIGDLIGVRVEDPNVFAATHSLVLRLIAGGKVSGLRIDHIDGLYDPLEYLRRLQQNAAAESAKSGRSPGYYVVVEKILSGDETLPRQWPVYGTTGYEFAKMLNAFFMESEGGKVISGHYSRTVGDKVDFSATVREKKELVIRESFSSEVAALGCYLTYLAGRAGNVPAVSPGKAGQAVAKVTACLPVYRTYIRSVKVLSRDRLYIEQAVDSAEKLDIRIIKVLDFLRRVLLLEFPAAFVPAQKKEWLRFVMRWQQLTGAIMAKGFEDTALYNYHRLISLNEVGGDPATGGLSVGEFHRWNRDRLRRWPHTLNATSTHDTKRSEDVRARISVLSEVADEWREHLVLWRKLNQAKKKKASGLLVPETSTEVLVYQTLLGAWPLNEEDIPDFRQRLMDYMVKAVREAKAHTSWLKKDIDYEAAVLDFVDAIISVGTDNDFLADFLPFQAKIAMGGVLNSLSQLLLKIALPGIPDFYQGNELWDFSLVDPDNRRPVDFEKRKTLLDDLIKREAGDQAGLIKELLTFWRDGRIKMYVTCKALQTRRSEHGLFTDGDYFPLRATVRRRENVVAFARRWRNKWVLVVVPRFMTKLTGGTGLIPADEVWGNSRIILPADAPESWRNVFTGESFCSEKGIVLATLLSRFPVAMLAGSH